MKIGIFDSGIGGLSVLHLAMRKLRGVDFIYYADEKNVPYGEKSKEKIIDFVDEAMRFFISKKTQAVVLACNTATSAAALEMRQKYKLPIIGMEPAVKKAIEIHGEKKVLVAATPMTVQGDKMNFLLRQVDADGKVDLVALPGLVRFAEKESFDSEEVSAYLQQELSPFSLSDYSAFVLGCTHFNYFKDHFRKIFPETVTLLDGNEGTINHLMSKLDRRGSETKRENTAEYYFSGTEISSEEYEKIKRYMKRLQRMLWIK